MTESFKRRFIRQNAELLSRLLRYLADQIDELVPGSPVAASVRFVTDEGGTFMSSITVQDDSAPLVGRVSFLDAEGHATTADDVPQWSSSDESVATVTADGDGLSASVEIGGPGAAIISVDSTNTDGSTVHSEGTITVQPGDAVIGSVEFEQPAEAAPAEPAPEEPPAEG